MELNEKLFKDVVETNLNEYRVAKGKTLEPKPISPYDVLTAAEYDVYADRDQKFDYYIKSKFPEKIEKAARLLKKAGFKFTTEKANGRHFLYFNDTVEIPKTEYRPSHLIRENKSDVVTIDIDFYYGEMSKEEVKHFFKDKYNIEAFDFDTSSVKLKGTKDTLVKYLLSDYYDMDLRDVREFYPQLLESKKPRRLKESKERNYKKTNDGKLEEVEIDGYEGTWYEIDKLEVNGKMYYLLESEIWGDEANGLVITKDQTEVYPTHDDIETTLIDLNILNEALKENTDYRLAAPNRAKMEDLLENGIITPEAIINMVAHYMSTDEEQEFLNHYDYNEETLDEIEVKLEQLAGNLLDWLSDDDIAELIRLNDIESDEELLEENINSKLNVGKEVKEIMTSGDEGYPYMMLGRLVQDCNYFLGYGKGTTKYLWAHNVEDQIALIKGIWNALKDKPEWLTMEDINKLEKDMLAFNKNLEENLEPIVYTDEERAAAGLVSVLNDLIKDEWEAVDFYNSAIVTAQLEGFTEIADVLYDILEEENVHIGQLQKCMEMLSTTTDKIKEGEKEAEEQLNDSEVEPEHIEQPQEDETV